MNAPKQTELLAGRIVKIGALALLVCAALMPNLSRLMDLWDLPPANVGEMTQRDQRLEPLRKALPKRLVGYVTDVTGEVESQKRMMLAQFSLAPAILVMGSEYTPIVADFSNPTSTPLGLDPGLTVVRDFGNGVMLLDRAPR
jgi:hypothetical protein